jgi:uncharacterized protein (DUF2267 family)
MTTVGIHGIERTIHLTNQWIKEIMEEMQTDDRNQAYLALNSTLHALRDRLVVDEAVNLGAQLPLLIRGLYYEGYSPSNKPVKARSRDEFFSLMKRDLSRTPGIDPEKAARSVFSVLGKRISRGEIRNVRNMLPEEIREIWH